MVLNTFKHSPISQYEIGEFVGSCFDLWVGVNGFVNFVILANVAYIVACFVKTDHFKKQVRIVTGKLLPIHCIANATVVGG